MFYRYRLLLFDEFRRGTIAVAYASGIYISGKLHLAKTAGRLVAGQELFDVITHGSLAAVHRFGRTRSKRQYELLAFQFVARAAVRESVTESLFHPAFQYRRCRVPEHGKLQHNDVSAEQALLFSFYIDFEVRIKFVELHDFGFRQSVAECFEDGLVGHRRCKVCVTADD